MLVRRALVLAAALPLGSVPAAADPVDRWAAEIAIASARFAIPEPWIRRVIRAESGGETLFKGKPVVSRAGAMGLMQLMPGTWRDLRALLGLGRDPHEPRDNILAGTAYLRMMYDRFGYPGLFAAYHAGPARYAAILSGRRTLPAETRAYVAAVAPDPRVRVTGSRIEEILFDAADPATGSAGRLSGVSGDRGLFIPLGASALGRTGRGQAEGIPVVGGRAGILCFNLGAKERRRPC